MSFDVWAGQLPRIEVCGSEGSLKVALPALGVAPMKIADGRPRRLLAVRC